MVRESALRDDNRTHFLGVTMDANVCRWIIASMMSYAPCDSAMTSRHIFPDQWILDTSRNGSLLNFQTLLFLAPFPVDGSTAAALTLLVMAPFTFLSRCL
jgi:hypothetical protein